ncbi:hypothetical protein [Streptomyces sp. NPDC004546]|uniref:hypothetical protein n=1 Tax=unclassified Streptomyces TaxID=2593676 RepID=UPI0033A235E8
MSEKRHAATGTETALHRPVGRWTAIDRDYEKIRIDMQTLFQHLGIEQLEIAP